MLMVDTFTDGDKEASDFIVGSFCPKVFEIGFETD